MKRSWLVWIGLAVLLIEVGSLGAQSPTYRDTSGRAISRNLRIENSAARQLIQQRALYQARQRIARMELQKWRGVSPLRPAVLSEPAATEWSVNRPYVLGAPYYVYDVNVHFSPR